MLGAFSSVLECMPGVLYGQQLFVNPGIVIRPDRLSDDLQEYQGI
ncbi:MAG TPA: hypothetical protein VK497_00465 [Candidatus Saccharimonadales bacterium]|nr:hypothetical protein [Candidatus Saccharimonadales bacterium]